MTTRQAAKKLNGPTGLAIGTVLTLLAATWKLHSEIASGNENATVARKLASDTAKEVADKMVPRSEHEAYWKATETSRKEMLDNQNRRFDEVMRAVAGTDKHIDEVKADLKTEIHEFKQEMKASKAVANGN